MSSVVPWASTIIGWMPHAIDSRRAVVNDGVAAMIGAVGRKREMARAVAPVRVHAMIAAASMSLAARHAAAEIAAVMRAVGANPGWATVCWRPRRLPQPT